MGAPGCAWVGYGMGRVSMGLGIYHPLSDLYAPAAGCWAVTLKADLQLRALEPHAHVMHQSAVATGKVKLRRQRVPLAVNDGLVFGFLTHRRASIRPQCSSR